MSRSFQNAVTGSPAWNRWLQAGLLAFSFTLSSASAWGWGGVLYEDHFNDESSLSNWGQSYGSDDEVYWETAHGDTLFTRDGGMSMEGYCYGGRFGCFGPLYDIYDDTMAFLNRDPQWKNFEFSIKVKSYVFNWDNFSVWNVHLPESRIILRTQNFLWDGPRQLDDDWTPDYKRGKGYAIQLVADKPAQWDPQSPSPQQPFSHINLIRWDCPSEIDCSPRISASADFGPLYLPIDVRILMNEGTVQVFLNGKKFIAYTDPDPLPAGGIGLGDNGTFFAFDDIVIKDRLNLRCSPDTRLDGNDRTCSGGLFKMPMRVHLWPPDGIERVDFYLDGQFRRTEQSAPWGLDGGKASRLSTGPHEVRAKIHYMDGRRATVTSSFDVGERPLRCSDDQVLDGKDPPCDGISFSKPMWVYWWPETGVKSVDFYVNRVFHRTERKAPFELDGGVASYLQPIPQRNVQSGSSGTNEIRAVARFADGRQPVTHDASVSVPRGLRCSPDHILDGNDPVCSDDLLTFTKPLWVYWWPETGVKSVDFHQGTYFDGPYHRTERKPPYELDGGAPISAQDVGRWCWELEGGYGCSFKAVVQFKDGSAPVEEEAFFLVSE